jgi:hypothetical protein
VGYWDVGWRLRTRNGDFAVARGVAAAGREAGAREDSGFSQVQRRAGRAEERGAAAADARVCERKRRPR